VQEMGVTNTNSPAARATPNLACPKYFTLAVV
jgi:hypothetical protein